MGEGENADGGDLTAAAELDGGEFWAALGDEDQCVVVYADGVAVAAEGEFGDGVEPGEDRREVEGDSAGGVEVEAAAVLTLHGEPAAADEYSGVPVVEAQASEDEG